MLGDEGAGVVELVGRLQGEGLDALHAPAGRCRSGCRRAASRACRSRRGRASSPCRGPSAPGGLTWVTIALERPRGRRGRPGRRGWRSAGCGRRGWRPSGPGGRARRRRGPCARCGTRRPPTAASAAPWRAASSAKAASCSTVPAATIWPGPLSLAAVRPCCSSAASTSSRSPPRTAVMLVGVVRGGRGHRVAALADQHHRLLGGDRPGTGRGGQLTDAVPGDGADLAERVGRVREQLEGGEQAGGDQQRLGDGGVADRLRVGLGAVVDQVEAGDRGQPGEALGGSWVLEPGGQEAGGLGPLAGSDDGEHTSTAVAPGPRTACSARTKIAGGALVGTLQRRFTARSG